MASPQRLRPPARNQEEYEQLLSEKDRFISCLDWDIELVSMDKHKVQPEVFRKLRKFWQKNWPYFPTGAKDDFLYACGKAFLTGSNEKSPSNHVLWKNTITKCDRDFSWGIWLVLRILYYDPIVKSKQDNDQKRCLSFRGNKASIRIQERYQNTNVFTAVLPGTWAERPSHWSEMPSGTGIVPKAVEKGGPKKLTAHHHRKPVTGATRNHQALVPPPANDFASGSSVTSIAQPHQGNATSGAARAPQVEQSTTHSIFGDAPVYRTPHQKALDAGIGNELYDDETFAGLSTIQDYQEGDEAEGAIQAMEDTADNLLGLPSACRTDQRSWLASTKRKLETDDDEGGVASPSSNNGDRRRRKRARTDTAPATDPGTDQNIVNSNVRLFLSQLRSAMVPWMTREFEQLAKRQDEVPNTEELKAIALNMLREAAPEQVDIAYCEKISEKFTSFFQGEINKLIDVDAMKKLLVPLGELNEFATKFQEQLNGSATKIDEMITALQGQTNGMNVNEKIAALQGQINGMNERLEQYERRLNENAQSSSSKMHQRHAQEDRGRHLTSLGICFGVMAVTGAVMAFTLRSNAHQYPLLPGI